MMLLTSVQATADHIQPGQRFHYGCFSFVVCLVVQDFSNAKVSPIFSFHVQKTDGNEGKDA